ncbi:MAG: AMP-binding protein [Oscillospiraceae bacterium]|nr:AMP-binding protein [Oscillospiraceae bacterium]
MANPLKNIFVRYDELADAVDFFSAQINTMVQTDERIVVSIFSENSIEWMLIFLSAVTGHNIIAPINHQIRDPEEIRRLINMTDIRLVFVSAQYKELFDEVINGWPAGTGKPAPLAVPIEETCGPVFKRFMTGGTRSSKQPPRRAVAEAATTTAAATATAAATEATATTEAVAVSNNIDGAETGKKPFAPDDYAILLFTSGSINTKGVMHSQRSLLSNQQSAAELLLVAHANEVFIAGLPLSHGYGLLCGFVPLYFGSTAVYAPTPRTLADNITASSAAFPTKGLIAVGVPELSRIMNQRIIRSVRSGSGKNASLVKKILGGVKYAAFLGMRRVNYFTSSMFELDLSGVFFKPIKQRFGNELKMPIGGGPSDKVTEYGLRSVGILALGGYGTTEMAPLVSAGIPHFKTIKTGTVGQAPGGVEVTLIDGEVCCRGPNMMLGYLNNEEATKKAMPGDGWYHTGDKGYYLKRGFGGRLSLAGYPPDYIYTNADRDCYLVLKGRVDNQFANHRGENIFPEVIESVLLKYPIVSSCRVYESPHTHVMADIFPDAEAMEQKLGRAPTTDEMKSMFSQIVKQANVQLQSGCGIDDYQIKDSDFERNAFGKIKRNVGG